MNSLSRCSWIVIRCWPLRDRVAKRPDNVLGLLVRPITHNEMSIMETRGCRAENWETIKVVEDFDPFRVRRTHLLGHCVLGKFTGEVEQEMACVCHAASTTRR